MNKKFLMMILLILLVGCKNIELYDSKPNVEILTDSLIYTENNTSSAVLGQVYSSSVYLEIESDDTWTRVEVNNVYGWIPSESCQKTDKQTVDYIPSHVKEFDVEIDYIPKGSVLTIPENEYDSRFIRLVVNGRLQGLETIFEDEGMYHVDFQFVDDLDRKFVSRKDLYCIDTKKPFKLLYEKPNSDTEVLNFIYLEDLSSDIEGECYITTVNECFVDVWHKITYEGEDVYFSEEKADDLLNYRPSRFIIEDINGVSHVIEDRHKRLKILKGFSPLYHLAIGSENYIDFFQSIKTGKIIDLSGIEIYDSGNMIVDFEYDYSTSVSKGKEKPLRVYVYNDGDYIVGYEDNRRNYGFADVFIREDILSYKASLVRNEWDTIWPYPEYHDVQVDLNDFKIIKDVNQSVTYDRISLENVNLYDIQSENKLKDKRDITQVDDFIFTRTYDLIDGQLCLWFEVRENDKLLGYTYRPIHENDGLLMNMWEANYLLTDDGNILELYHDWDMLSRAFYLDLSLLNQEILIVRREYEGDIHTAYSMIDAEIVFKLDGWIEFSEDKSLIANADIKDTSSPILSIHHLKDKTSEKLLDLFIDDYYISNLEWISEGQLSLSIKALSNDEQVITFSIKLSDKGWVVLELPIDYDLKLYELE